MAKQAYVYSGTDWVPLASEVTNLSTYQTKAATGLIKLIPTSVAVGSGSGSASASGTVTFSGASSVTLNNVFSATYDTYQIIVSNLTGATNGNLYLRFTSGGTQNTDNVFNIENLVVDGTSVSTSSYTAAEYVLGAARTTVSQISTFVTRPFTAAPKSLWSSGGGAGRLNLTTANYGNSISFDGFRLIGDAATMSGTITVLGIN
jgi:hypothetical protein